MTDENWLKEQMPDANEDQQDYFLERVAICHYDGKMDIDRARELGLKLMKFRFNGIKKRDICG